MELCPWPRGRIGAAPQIRNCCSFTPAGTGLPAGARPNSANPNRCGQVHRRGPMPTTAASKPAPPNTKGWVIGGLAAAVVILAVILALTIGFGGGSDSGAPATTRKTTSAYPPSSSAEPTSNATQTTPSAVSFVVPQSLYRNADTYGDTSCSNGRPIPNSSGYYAGLGSESTSCAFAVQVGRAYLASNPNPGASSRSQTVVATGTVPCTSVPTARCSGDDFIMTCAIEGGDRWVTCRGGREAVVYIF